MIASQCLACSCLNPPAARWCVACGMALVDADTVPATLPGAARERPGDDFQVSALWFDELGQALSAPRGTPGARRVLPDITVREINLPSPFRRPAGPVPAARPARPAAQAPAVAPAPAPAAAQCPAAPAEITPLPTDRAARTAIKVARRAAVRHARQAATLPLVVSDVLVVDVDANARHGLDALLTDLGFRVRPVASLAQAALLATHHPFAAVFVAVPPGAIDGAVHDLFDTARATGQRVGIAATARVLVSAQWHSVDRVRAELAGCGNTLCKPVSRRDVARVLDTHGVKLPHDPRQR